MQTFLYPTSIELNAVDQNLLPVLMMNDPIFQLFPPVEHDAARVTWEQEDNYLGLMQMRGYEGEFPSVPGTGIKRYSMEPGVYGEYDVITELEITERRGFGQLGTPIDISDLILMRHKKLMTRHYNRMSWVLWTLLGTGVYTVPGPTGAILKTDTYIPQTYTAGIPWATTATATPLADLRAVTLLHRGYSANFGTDSTVFVNLKTFNNMIANSNQNDLGGRRAMGFASIEGMEAFNKLATQDNLPTLQVWDKGYISDGYDGRTNGQWYPFIADNTAIVVGRRDNGANLGEFVLTRNANNPDLGSTPFVKVVDSAEAGGTPPRTIKIYRSFNGGPCVYYPGSVVVMSV